MTDADVPYRRKESVRLIRLADGFASICRAMGNLRDEREHGAKLAHQFAERLLRAEAEKVWPWCETPPTEEP